MPWDDQNNVFIKKIAILYEYGHANQMSGDLYQAADWVFLAEGGQHVVCRYTGNALLLQGMLLRLRKCLPARNETAEQRLAFMQQEEEYLHKIVMPLLDPAAQYVIRYVLVHLPSGFVDELARAIATERPPSRQWAPLRWVICSLNSLISCFLGIS